MSGDSTSGLISRINWGESELLLQTEIRSDPDPSVTTLLLSGGEVTARAGGRWGERATDQVVEQRRIGEYHDLLLRALRRLRSRQEMAPKEVALIFQKLVDVALRMLNSPTLRIMDAMPGARWAALLGPDGKVLDSAPDKDSGGAWHGSAAGFFLLAERLRVLFKGGPLIDISLRTPGGYVLVAPHWGGTLVAEVEEEKLAEARQYVRSTQLGKGQ